MLKSIFNGPRVINEGDAHEKKGRELLTEQSTESMVIMAMVIESDGDVERKKWLSSKGLKGIKV